jgi:hypothetical protein
MQPLSKEDAIKLIKQVLDESVKAGLFHNIETAVQINNAWAIINELINKD